MKSPIRTRRTKPPANSRCPSRSSNSPSAPPTVAAPQHTSTGGPDCAPYAASDVPPKAIPTAVPPTPHRSDRQSIVRRPREPIPAHGAPLAEPHQPPSKFPATRAQPCATSSCTTTNLRAPYLNSEMSIMRQHDRFTLPSLRPKITAPSPSETPSPPSRRLYAPNPPRSSSPESPPRSPFLPAGPSQPESPDAAATSPRAPTEPLHTA